jgi:hypothetical protein
MGLCLSAVVGSAGAAPVLFSAFHMTGDTDVISPSSTELLLDAYAVGYTASISRINNVDPTVNGVAFAPIQLPGQNGDFTFSGMGSWNVGISNASGAPYSSLSANYQSLIYFQAWSANSSTPMTVTISNLQVGSTYTAQFWVEVGSASGNYDTFSSGGNSVSDVYFNYDYVVNSTAPTSGLGMYVDATFQADASTQVFTITGSNTDAIISAYDLFEQVAAVPEPSTVALLAAGAGMLGLAAVRRSRGLARV